MTTCLVRRVKAPPEILGWTMQAMQYESIDQAATSVLSFSVAKFSELRSKLADPQYTYDPYSVVNDALEIEQQLQEWTLNVPSSFFWTSVPIPAPDEEVFADYYDLYHDVFTAGTLNSIRGIRIMLHEILIEHIVKLCSSPEYITPNCKIRSYRAQICTSKIMIDTLTHEICASVPFYFNYHRRDLENFGVRPQPKAVAGYLLMWPLYTAAVAGRVSAQMRRWIAERLKDIGDVMGMKHAYALSLVVGIKREVLLEAQKEAEEWEEHTKEAEEWEEHTKESASDGYESYCDASTET
jgi:hypothetical protein